MTGPCPSGAARGGAPRPGGFCELIVLPLGVLIGLDDPLRAISRPVHEEAAAAAVEN